MTHPVAHNILAQLGGNRFLAMTGASNLTGRADGLSFKIGRNASKITHVRVTLTAMDDYQVEFLAVRGTRSIKPVAFAEGIQADGLARVFVEKTGMQVSL